jgi:PKD domain
MGESMSMSQTGRNRSRRAMSSATAVVVLVVTIVVLGAISFVAFNSLTPAATCAPAASPACAKTVNLHDVNLLSPFKTTQQAQLIPFTAILTAGETATQFKFNFGDGVTTTTSSPTADHAYANPGTYLVYVQALVKGVWHDNLNAIPSVLVTSSHIVDTLGAQPGTKGVIDANSTTTVDPSGVIAPTQFLTVTAEYTSHPSDPAYVLIPPHFITSGGSLGTTTNSLLAGFNQSTVTATFADAGVYTITWVAGSQLTPTSPIQYQNYSWTAYVSSPSGSAIVLPIVNDPHPGTVIAYEYVPGGGLSEDPNVDYETAGYEVILNVYESLIGYNGTQAIDSPNGYIPEIATCVPGSATCGLQFPTEPAGDVNLVDGYNYTFVIGDYSHFYDPATGTSWPVYASDVLFTMARDIAMASDGEATPGWVQGQALLPGGTAAACSEGALAPGCYDMGLHTPYNSTPWNIFQHVLVNDSAFCPSSAMTNGMGYDGCVTFVANGSGTVGTPQSWPFFLELMSAIGSGIVPAGWFSEQGSVLPGWTDYKTYQGDHPVLLPGNATSSTQPAFQAAIDKIGNTSWDTMIGLLPDNEWGNVQYNMAGSGPYYLAGYTIGSSYTLEANPAYEPNPSCSVTYLGQTNYCYPQAGAYAKQIDVTWETDPTPGEAAMASGVADYNGQWATTQTALLLQLIEEGKANLLSVPSISVFFFPFDMDFSAAAAGVYPTGPITAPADFFNYIGMRNFFTTAFPYSTSQATVNTVDGVQYGFNYGGMIPQGMGNYYPTNISWPDADPTSNATNPASPVYWWDQMQDKNSIYYDPEVAACIAMTGGCQLPFFGQTGAPNYDQAISLMTEKVAQYSGGSIVIHPIDINFIQLVLNSLFSPPGQDPMPIFTLAWAPDYPDPTDYVGAMYYPNATYTYSDDYQLLGGNQTPACEGYGAQTYSWTQLLYWAGPNQPISQACQGAAFTVMTNAEYFAATDLNLANRALVYNEAEHIAEKLALYVYFYQENVPFVFAPWVNPASLDQHVTIGGGQDVEWFWLNGNHLASATAEPPTG